MSVLWCSSNAAEALGNLGTASDLVVQGLLASLNSECHQVHYCSIEAPRSMRYRASDALVQKLLASLSSSYSRVRY